MEEEIRIKSVYLPGKKNKEADSLSRLSKSGDYGIKKEILKTKLLEWKIKIEIDAFANRRNRKAR
jgi:hypothetical protein